MLEAVFPLHGQLHHVQGLDVEDGAGGGRIAWTSSVDAKAGRGYLSRFELPSGRMVSQVEVQDGRRIHPGGIALDGDALWMPVAEYDRDGPTSIEKRDKRTLARITGFTVADHIGCVAAGAQGLVGGSWDSRTIYLWSRDGAELSRRANPRPAAYQDIKIAEGLVLASGNLTRTTGAIDWLSWPGLELHRRLLAGTTDRGVRFTNEGMTIRNGRLYLMPEDDPSRIFVYHPMDRPRTGRP